jgi:poly(A) polymerase
VEAVLLALSEGDRRPTRQSVALEHRLGFLLERRLRPQPPLLSGEEVMALTTIPRGPEVGRLLQRIEELRADGILTTAEDARRWLLSTAG